MTALDVLASLGCLAWLWAAWCAARTVRVVRRLDDVAPVLPRAPRTPSQPSRAPSISIVAPARNEAATIEAAAGTWLADPDPALELVLVDDRSDDGTGAAVERLAARDPRVVPVHVAELPDGWMGKPHALHVGALRARGEWLLLTDADVHIVPGTVRRAVALCAARGIDHLVALPDVGLHGLWFDATVAAFGRLFGLAQRLWAVRRSGSGASVGVGAFNLVRRSAFEAVGGMSALRFDVADDIGLGKLLKQSGARCEVVSGRGLVAVDWYRSLGAMARGLEKNSYAVLGCSLTRVVLFTAALLALEAAPWVALLAGSYGLVVASGAAALLAGLASTLAWARWAGRPLLPAALLPLGMVLLCWVVLRAGVLGALRGGIRWRGTFYPADAVRRGVYVRRR